MPTALLPGLLTSTLGAPAAALGLIEGISDGLAGAARLSGGAIADDPARRRVSTVGGYTATAVLSALIGVAGAAWQLGVLRPGAWAARGLRVPARNALLADAVPREAYASSGRWTTWARSAGRSWPRAHAAPRARSITDAMTPAHDGSFAHRPARGSRIACPCESDVPA